MDVENRQSVGTHLDELRRRLFRGLIAVSVVSIIAFTFAPYLFRWLLHPYHAFLAAHGQQVTGAVLQTLEPSETFMMSFELSFILALIALVPYLLFEFWSFIQPGLMPNERRWLAPALAGGVGLFGVGVAFAYYFVLPAGLGFFWEYSLHLGITPGWTVQHYVGFVVEVLAAFGIAFELPLVIMGLAALGFVTPAFLKQHRRYAYFLISIVAAILTPPDVLSMCMMGIPLIGLYEVSIVLARAVARPRSGKVNAEGEQQQPTDA